MRVTGLLALLVLVLAANAVAPKVMAQGVNREGLKRRYEAKLEARFLKVLPWEHRLEDAMAKAKKKNLPILAYFTRSYSP